MNDAMFKSGENKQKKSGGRPLHDGWTLYHFEKVEGDKGKSVAKCIKCSNLLKNTTILRLLAHRKKCGRVLEPIINPSSTQNSSFETLKDSTPLTKSLVSVSHQTPLHKIEINEFEVHQQSQHQQQEVLWTQTQNTDTFMDESANISNPSTIDVLNEDIQRHRKSQLQQCQRQRSENTVIDSALSSFLIGCNLTFDIVGSKHFKNFVSALNPNYKIPSSSQLTSKVLNQLKGGKESSCGSEGLRGTKKRKYYSSDDDSDYE